MTYRRHLPQLARYALCAGALAAMRAAPLIAQASTVDAALRDLPLTEVRAQQSGTGTIAIFLSGDGGWSTIDKQVAQVFAAHGIGVVGLDSRAYLSTQKSREQAAIDIARIAHSYLAQWAGRRLVLIGYSRGAVMIPFVATRLPADLKGKVALLAMLGLEQNMNFQFHWTDMVRTTKRADDLPVPPELARLRGMPMLCVYGTEEQDSPCRSADPTLMVQVARRGGHHFDGDYRALGELLVAAVSHAAP